MKRMYLECCPCQYSSLRPTKLKRLVPHWLVYDYVSAYQQNLVLNLGLLENMNKTSILMTPATLNPLLNGVDDSLARYLNLTSIIYRNSDRQVSFSFSGSKPVKV